MINIFSELYHLDFGDIIDNTEILETILAEIFEENVKVIGIIPSTLYHLNKNNKVKVINLVVELSDVKKIVVELNIIFDKNYKLKHLPYDAFKYLDSLNEEMDVVQISLNFSEDTKKVEKKNYFLISHETKEILTESFKIMEVIVPKSNE